MAQPPSDRTHLSEQDIYNLSFDETFDVLKIIGIGYDSTNNVLRRIAVDSNGQLKLTKGT